MPPKPQMIAKQDWRYVSGGGRVLRNAHEPSTEITSLAFASNGHSLVSRGADATLKVRLLPTSATLSVPQASRYSVTLTTLSFKLQWLHTGTRACNCCG